MKSTRYVQVWMQHKVVQTLVICIDLFVSGFAIFDLFAAVYDLNCVCVLTFHLQFYITHKAKSLGVNITFLKLKPTRSCNFNRGSSKYMWHVRRVLFISKVVNTKMIFISFQSYINSGDYDDEEEYPDLNDRLEAYKSKNPAGLNLKVTLSRRL